MSNKTLSFKVSGTYGSIVVVVRKEEEEEAFYGLVKQLEVFLPPEMFPCPFHGKLMGTQEKGDRGCGSRRKNPLIRAYC